MDDMVLPIARDVLTPEPLPQSHAVNNFNIAFFWALTVLL